MNDHQHSPPLHNRDAERSLLGSMLREKDVIPEAINLVKADDFYVFGHQKIFEAITDLYGKGQPADIITVVEWLTKEKCLDDVGGPIYVAELQDTAPSAANYRQYAEIMCGYALRRAAILASQETVEAAHDRSTDPAQMLAEAEQRLLEIVENRTVNNTRHISDTFRETLLAMDERRSRRSGVLSGFSDLDALNGGFQPSQFILIAARPSCGKTALAVNIARHVVIEESTPVLFISLEQTRVELTERFVCCQARVDSHRMRTHRLRPAESERFFEAGDLLSRANLFIDDTPGQTLTRIGANAKRMKRQHGIGLIIVDYLQLVTIEGKKENRQEAIASISRRFKLLSRELAIPVIVLAQLNRQIESRVDQRPKLSDLRESGALEQDADFVAMIHRHDSGDRAAHDGLVDLVIAKHRNGPTGEARLIYIKQHMRFENFVSLPNERERV